MSTRAAGGYTAAGMTRWPGLWSLARTPADAGFQRLQSVTLTPPENGESCSSRRAIVAPFAISNTTTALTELPGLMLLRNEFPLSGRYVPAVASDQVAYNAAGQRLEASRVRASSPMFSTVIGLVRSVRDRRGP